MTNFEYYAEDIKRVSKCNKNFGVCGDKIFQCDSSNECINCIFYDIYDTMCSVERIKWLYEEHKEKLVLSEVEIAYLKYLSILGIKYLAKSISGDLYMYYERPTRKYDSGSNNFFRCDSNPNDLFKFIKWEDREPWNIEELLKDVE